MNDIKRPRGMMQLTATYKDIVGVEIANPSSHIEAALRKYSLMAVLEFCAKLSVILFKDSAIVNWNAQIELLKVLFKDQHDIVKRAERLRQANGINVFFAETQVVTLVETALKVCPLEGGQNLDDNGASELAKLLLLTQDAHSLVAEDLKSAAYSIEYKKDMMLKYMSRQFYGRSMGLGSAEVEFQRSREVFHIAAKSNPELLGDFSKAAGMSFEEYEQFSFCLFPKNLISNSALNLDHDWYFDVRTYLSKTDLDPQLFQEYLNKISMTLSDYQAVARSKDDFLKTLAERPVVNYGNLYAPLSINHLIRQIGDNIYWTLFHYYEQKDMLGSFGKIWGGAFEEYAEGLCRQIDKNAQKLFYAPKGKTRTIEGADCFIVPSNNKAVLFEFKVGKMPVAALLNPTGKELKKYFRRTFAGMRLSEKERKGFGQLLNTARAVRNGEVPEIDANSELFIIVVMQQPLPGDAFTRTLIKELFEETISWPVKTYPIFINVRDLETMAMHYDAESGAFAETLGAFHDYEWDTTPDNFYADFRNYAYITEGKIFAMIDWQMHFWLIYESWKTIWLLRINCTLCK